MTAPIELDHKARVGAEEIDHVWSKGMLPSKLHAGETPVSKLKPQSSLRIGRKATQDASFVEVIAV